MKINCDWEECVIECKHYYVCPLRNAYSSQLTKLEKEVKYQFQRLNQINGGINECFSALREYDALPELIQRRITKKELEMMIKELRNEKKEILSELRIIQRKESNIRKILNRREQNVQNNRK